MQMLSSMMINCSENIGFSLAKADLIPQLINTLNPLSLSFAETDDIQTGLMRIIWSFLWLTTPDGLTRLGLEDENGQQTIDVHQVTCVKIGDPVQVETEVIPLA
ncbi:hypothetical protein BLNAU_12461 [Blattamonas nauphoetae]|uniref:Uncharacterized protein n=1 Tax=Blattamonas nauphoetae TaxID=2049346 RepID=A0ABQ9XJL3_9EUKA|nr:hypothetical protein BLNAU_12461 [Blattamonas nauphoetae]